MNKTLLAIKNNFLCLNRIDCENLKLTFCNGNIMEVENILNSLELENNKYNVIEYELVLSKEERIDKLCLNHCDINKEFISKFREQFKIDFKKHLNNIDEFKSNVFVIEYNGVLPAVRNLSESIKDFYTVHIDEDLLNFIYEYKDEVKYIFYKYKDRYEVISSKKIPSIINDILKEETWEFDTEKVDSKDLYREV